MTSNIHKLMTLSFWSGVLAFAGLHMFIQDWLGLERYIEHARMHWWDIHWMWGAAMFALAILFYYNKRVQVAFWLKVDAKKGTDHDESDTP